MNKRHAYIMRNGTQIAEGRISYARQLQSQEVLRHLGRMITGIRDAVTSLEQWALEVRQIAKQPEQS